MNFDESTINEVHQQSGFDQLYIEKVLRLLGILELIFSNPRLKDKYVLKGGTALNLFYFQLPRLSVDIDLNYLGVDRSAMSRELGYLKEEGFIAVKSRKITLLYR